MFEINEKSKIVEHLTNDKFILFISIISCFALLSVYPTAYVEIFGFATGLLCVVYIVKENIWNFPIGILNNVFFIILFYEAALYADMGLQAIYILLAMIGLYAWMYGGKDKTELVVNTSSYKELVVIGIFILVGTYFMTQYLTSINDSFPFLDALTTCMSLGAQWLLNFKRIENWVIWMLADIIYVWLYIQKSLNLTALLYVVFFCLCTIGLYKWYQSWYKINNLDDGFDYERT